MTRKSRRGRDAPNRKTQKSIGASVRCGRSVRKRFRAAFKTRFTTHPLEVNRVQADCSLFRADRGMVIEIFQEICLPKKDFQRNSHVSVRTFCSGMKVSIDRSTWRPRALNSFHERNDSSCRARKHVFANSSIHAKPRARRKFRPIKIY